MDKKYIFHREHPILFYIILLLAIMIILYFVFAFYISITLNGVIKKAINDEPYDNSLNHIISVDNYDVINPRQPECEEGATFEVERSNSFPIVFPIFTDAYFKYSYIVTDKDTNEVIYGSSNSHVTIKLEYTSFPVHISDIEKAP